MALPPGVPQGARKLVITSLLTPACFWGHEEFDKCKSRDIEKLDLLEKEISRVYRNSKFGDEQHHIPVENELVAVLDPIRKTWVRGRVMKWNNKSHRGEVFLVDYGSHLSDVQLVRPLPSHAHEIKYQAVQVFLYGVLPLTGQYDHKHGRFNQTLDGRWVAAALRKVQDLLSESIGFYFTCCRCWGEALLGDLLIHRGDESRAISLAKALIDEKLAVYDYDRFNKEIDNIVGSLMLSSSRGEELRTVCMGAGTTFATIAQRYRDPAPPLKELSQLSVNYREDDDEFAPAGAGSTSLQPPTKRQSSTSAGPRDAQCLHKTPPRENVQQLQGPNSSSHFTNDRQMQGSHRGGASNFQNRDRSGPKGRNSYVGQRDGGRAPPMGRGERFEDRDSYVGQRDGGKAPPMGRGERFEDRDSYVGQRDGGRAPPMGRGERFVGRDSYVGQRDGGRAPPMGRGERFEDRDNYVGQRDGGRAPPMGRGERFEGRGSCVGQRYGGRAPPVSSEDEEVRRLTMGRDNQRNELKSPPRKVGQFNRDVDMASPPGQHSAKGQHSSSKQPGPYGDENVRRGPINSRSPPPQPHELPSRSRGENVSGISKLQVQERPSSMLTQLTGPNSQDAETVYKKPQPRVEGPPQKAYTAQTQSSGPATHQSGPGAVNIMQDATRPVPPAPVNKYANRGFGVKKQTGSNSNSSTNSNKEDAQWFPPLLNMNHPQLPVLVQGCDLSKPLDSLGKAPLHIDIHRSLEQMRVNSLTIQQKHMLPAIFRGQNVVSVGPADSGKTLGFVIPLASSMLDPSKYIELKDMFGPLVLILCANSERATLIDKWLRQLTRCDLKDYVYSYNKGYKNTKPRVKVLLTYGGGAEKEKLMELFNGCHVLISTPPCLLRMLSFWEEVLTNFDRLCHLVFDDADILFEKFNLQVSQILSLAQKGILCKERKGRHLETIVTTKRWTEALEQFTSRVLTNPTIIINTGLEVMAYSKVAPSLHVVDILDTRTDVLTDIVKSQKLPYKMVVACTFQYEVLDIHRSMQSRKQKEDSMLLLMAHEGINQLGLISIKEKWESNSNVVLLVSDTVLSEMNIFDASVLVLFSMTDQRSYFNTRMSTIIKKCPDRFGSLEEQRVKPEVHMLIIEQDTVQIPVLLELMRRLKAPISDVLLEREKQENLKKEERKKQLPLCDQLCCFGTCTSLYSCPYRHSLITEMDKSPQYIPQTGEVEVKPLTVHNATHFSARIEGHRAPGGKLTPTDRSEQLYLPIEIAEHFSIPSNSAGEHEEMLHDEPQKSPDADVNEVEEEHIKEGEQMDLAFDQKEEVEFKDIDEGLDIKEEGELEDESDTNDAAVRDPRSPIDSVVSKKPKLEGEAAIFHVRSDLFEAPADYSLAHCVAEDLVMKRGVAKTFCDRFGQQAVLRAQRKRCGQVAYIKAEGRYVFYLITKQRTNNQPISLEILQTCLVELRRLCHELKVQKLAIPQLGRGLNHMKWEDVKTCLEDIFSQSGIKIGVYHILMLEILGDLMTAPPAFSLAHCVAEDLVMSRGVARAFRFRFGRQAQLVQQKKKVGQVAYLKDGRRYVFYLITKRFSSPDCKPDLETLRSSLLDLKDKCLELKVFNLAMPRIGTGIDQLSWCDVRRYIEDIFQDTDIEIRVYQLPCKPNVPCMLYEPPELPGQEQVRLGSPSRPQGLLRNPSNQLQSSPRQVFHNPDQQGSPMQHSPFHFGTQSPSFDTTSRQCSNFEGQRSPHARNPQNQSSQNNKYRGFGRGQSFLTNQKDDSCSKNVGGSLGFYREKEIDW